MIWIYNPTFAIQASTSGYTKYTTRIPTRIRNVDERQAKGK